MNKKIAIRLYVDEHDLTHWQIYARETGLVLSNVRTCPPPGKHGNGQLSRTIQTIKEVA